MFRLDLGFGAPPQNSGADQGSQHECHRRDQEENPWADGILVGEREADAPRKDLGNDHRGRAQDSPEPLAGCGQHPQEKTDDKEGEAKGQGGGDRIQGPGGHQFHQNGPGGEHQKNSKEA